MSLYKRLLLLLVLTLPCVGLGQEMPEGRLMRFPDIHKDKIVFMYGGDLWLASSNQTHHNFDQQSRHKHR